MAAESVLRSQAERLVERRRGRLARAVLPWFLLVLPLLFGVAGAFSFRYLEKPSSRATAQVILPRPGALVGPVHGVDLTAPDHGRYLRVMSALARSPSLVNGVVRAANVPGLTAAGLLAKTRVTAEGDGNVLEFTVTNASLATARRLAYIYASEYAKAQNERAVRQISDTVKQLRATIASLPRKSATRASLIREAKQWSVVARLAAKGTSVLGQASATPVRKHELRNGIIGGLLGLLVGIALLLGLFHTFPTLRLLVVRRFTQPLSPARSGRFWIRAACLASPEPSYTRPPNSRSAHSGQ